MNVYESLEQSLAYIDHTLPKCKACGHSLGCHRQGKRCEGDGLFPCGCQEFKEVRK